MSITIKIRNGEIAPPSNADSAELLLHTSDHKLYHGNPSGSAYELVPELLLDTSPQLGGDLDLNDKAVDVSKPSADHLGEGIKYAGIAGETLAIGELVYAKLSTTTRWFLTDADAEATAKGPLGIALNAATVGNAVNIFLYGVFRDDTYAWTVGAQLYIGLTAGTFTETAPSATGDIVRPVGMALDADTILFTPGQSWVEIT